MKKNYFFVLLFMFSFCALAGQISAQIAITSFSPQNNKTNVPLNQVISVTFNTPLDTSVHLTKLNNKWLPVSFFSNIQTFNAVSISPDLRTVNFSPKLNADSAYFFCVASAFGSGKVRLTSPSVFYFTTKSSFPQLTVSGTISSSVSGVTVENSIVGLTLFDFSGDFVDNKYNYMAVADNQGNFTIPYISDPGMFGFYYIRAVKDLNQNGIFDYTRGDASAYTFIMKNESGGFDPVSLVYEVVFMEPPTLVSPADNSVNVAIPVTLSWTHSGGATQYWMQISTDPDFNSTVADTFGITTTSWRISNLVPSTKYYWRGYAFDDAGGFSYISSVYSFTTVGGLPPKPELESPENGAIAQNKDLDLRWKDIPADVEYNIQVSTSSAFTTKLVDTLLGKGENYYYATNLTYATKYYWKVRAKNVTGYGPFSDTWNFTTLMGVPGVVTLVSPNNNEQLSNIAVDLEWAKLSDAQYYNIQISKKSDFSDIQIESYPSETNFRTSTLDPFTRHYWRVRGSNNIGNGAWSEVRSFITWKAPDLVVTNVTAPLTSYSGREIEVKWTVKNTGAGATTTPDWRDYIYIQPDSVFNLNNATEIGSAANVSALNINESYERTQQVTLPQGIQGKFYIFVFTDKQDVQVELSNTNNTRRTSSQIQISMTPPPDLVITSLVIPDQTYNGKKIPITFTVTNKGTGPTIAASWYDYVYLSLDSTVDNKAIYLGGFHRQGILKKDSSYTIQDSLQIPHNVFGKYNIIVVADRNNNVFEFTAESNNVKVVPVQILVVSTPDLVVNNIKIPAAVNSGQKVKLEWTIKNQGLSETFESGWYDRLYLTKSTTLDEKTASVIATVHHGGALYADSVYTVSDSFMIPNGLSGDYFLFVKTDFDTRVFEHTYDDNNILKSSSAMKITMSPWADLQVQAVYLSDYPVAGQAAQVYYEVKNMGAGATNSNMWVDRIYVSTNPVWSPASALMLAEVKINQKLAAQQGYSHTVNVILPVTLTTYQYVHIFTDYSNTVFENTDENNNLKVSARADLKSFPPSDYAVVSLKVPASGNSGRQIQVEWSVKNNGNITPLSTSWFDNIYLSSDNQYSTNDVLLGSFQNSNPLKPGTSYTRTESVTIPGDASGTYYIIAAADAKVQINDSDPANNIKASSAINVVSVPAPDLQLLSLTIPAEAYANQPINIQWTTKNNGPGSMGEYKWSDIIYLSNDTIIDNYDKQLGFVEKSSMVMNAGTSYAETQQPVLPNYAAGKYYLIVKTDGKNEVYEKTNEGNNVRYKAFNIVSSPVVDLAVKTISIPVSTQTGDEVTINYIVQNLSSNTAQGWITDAVYISSDSKWEVSDPMLGMSSGYVNISPGTSTNRAMTISSGNPVIADANGNITGTVPGILQGSYYIIVKVNIKKNLPEITDTNNTRASTQKMSITLPELVLGVSKNAFVTQSEQQFYKIQNVTSGKTLKITLKSTLQTAGSEIFLKLNTPPSAADYDFATKIPAPDQEVIIPETQNGTYYIFVRDRSLFSNDSTHFQILAEYVNFSISAITPARGGNTGEVTVAVSGARFDEDCIVSLVNKSGKSARLVQKYFKDASSIDATFDMTGSDLALGAYDVVVKRKDGSQVTLKDGFTLEVGRPMEVAVGFSPPTAILRGSAGNFSLSFQNTSNIDVPFVNGVIIIPEGQKYTLFSDKVFTAGKLAENPDYSVLKPEEYVDYDGWRIIPIFAKGLRVGEIMNVYIQVENVQGDEFPVQAYANAYDRRSFINEQLEYLEAFRQAILSDSARENNPELFYLAQSKEKFLQEVFKVYVAAGLFTDADLSGVSFAKVSSSFLQELNEEQRAAFQKLAITSCQKAVMWATVAVKFAFGAMKLVLVPVTGGAALIFVAKTAWSIASTYNNIKKGKPSFLAKLICKYIPVIAAMDPNDIIGPEGYGTQRWVSVSQTMPFTIRFENDPKLATAPAQVVKITQQLDRNADPKSFRLGDFGFGKFRIDVPENVSFFTKRVDATEALKVQVDFEAGIDVSTNTAFWMLKSVDPSTGQAPINPLMGFLAINDSLHSGEGFVTYSIRPKSTAKTKDLITSKASIVFDNNASIETPAVYNTIDAALPVSRVEAMNTWAREQFRVKWSGSDDSTGSGIGSYSIYIAENDGPFQLWLSNVTNTDTTYIGKLGSSYKFFSIAKDNAGNTEVMKSEADASTTVTGVDGEPSLPKEYALKQNYPNPFNPVTTIRYELPFASRVTIRIYNILGEVVATLADGIEDAGVKQLQFRADQYASGVYIYEMDASSLGDGIRARFVKKMMVLK